MPEAERNKNAEQDQPEGKDMEAPPSRSEENRRTDRIVLHPLLVAVFPILSLFSQNPHYVAPADLLLPIVTAIAAVTLLYLGARLILRDSDRAALIASVAALLFFSYGPLFVRFRPNALSERSAGYEWFWLGLWASLLTAAIAACIRTRRNLRPMTTLLNRAALFLVGLPLVFGMVALATGSPGAARAKRAAQPSVDRPTQDSTGEISGIVDQHSAPDIYYIVLDGYGRADVLEELYGLDNSPFLDELRSMGFRVLPAANANYIFTFLSIASALNLDYIQNFEPRPGPGEPRGAELRDRILNAELIRFLKDRGYSIVAFPTGVGATDMRDADYYFRPPLDIDEFQSALLAMTPLAALGRAWRRGSDPLFDVHRRRIRFVLDRMADTAEIDSPKFVFAHLLAPHAPFVFGPHGGPRRPKGAFNMNEANVYIETEEDRREYRRLHADQVRGLNRWVLRALKHLLDRSPQPPIVIVQGDHGPGSELNWFDLEQSNLTERLGILNAIYLPGGDYQEIYDSMSPVNTFRLILRRYFGADMAPLEDRSYFSPWDRPFDFVDVTGEL